MSRHPRFRRVSWIRRIPSGGLVWLILFMVSGCRREVTVPVPSPATTEVAAAIPTRSEPPEVDLAGQDEAIVAAVEKAARWVRREPSLSDAWGHLGMVLMVHGFNGPAGVCLVEAALRDPAEARWPYFQYSLVRETNRPAALVHLQRAAAILNPRTQTPETRRGVRQRLAEALIEDGQAAAALEALREEPEDRMPHPGHELLRARGHLQLGQWTEARTHADAAATAPESRGDALRLLAQLDQRAGNPTAARARLLEAAPLPVWRRIDPLSDELQREGRGLRVSLQIANELLNAGRFAEVRQMLNQTVLTYPGSAYAWLILGKAEMAATRWERAENCFRRAVTNDPTMIEAHVQLGQALRGQQRLQEAAASFRQGTQLKRDSVPAQYLLGLTLTELGQWSEALQPFQVCVECRPQYAESHLRLAQVHARLGQSSNAAVHLETARRLTPFEAATTNFLQQVERELSAPEGH